MRCAGCKQDIEYTMFVCTACWNEVRGENKGYETRIQELETSISLLLTWCAYIRDNACDIPMGMREHMEEIRHHLLEGSNGAS